MADTKEETQVDTITTASKSRFTTMAAIKGKQEMKFGEGTGKRGGAVVRGGKGLMVYSEDDKPGNMRKTDRKLASLTGAKSTEGTLNKMENTSKGKGVLSVYNKVGRKPLVDVSNISSNNAKNIVHDGSKIVKGDKNSTLKRVSLRPSARAVNVVSRKSSMGKVSGTEAASDEPSSKKGSTSLLDNKSAKTKGQERESLLVNRRNSKIPTVSTRKSFPVQKRMNQADASGYKENAESSEKAKDSIGFSVKAKLGTKVVYRLSNNKNQLLRNRASDGFMTSIAKDLHNKVAPSLKNTVKASRKNASRTSVACSTLTSKIPSGVNKPSSDSASSKKNKEVVRSSPPKVLLDVGPYEVSQEKPSFDGKTEASTSSSDIGTKKKSKRRRSYTSLLIASSKLLEEHGKVLGQENLPSIDDNCNQLEVAEYVDEIYQYYWIMEAQNPLPENYMSIQMDITPHMRGILVNWLIEVHFKFELMPETLYLMVNLLDRYLSQVNIKKSEMQLVGLTALLLASKYEDFWHPRVKDLIGLSAESYTKTQMLGMEKLMLKTLKFRLNMPTPYVFLLRFLKAAQSDSKLEHLAFYLIELNLVEYEALKFKPSLLCASAIYVARSTLQMTPLWTPLLQKHARYDVSQLRDCANMILKVHKGARKRNLKVTYEKYMNSDLSSVAAIKPLDSLP